MTDIRSGYKHWKNLGQAGDVCFVTTTIEEFVPVLAEDAIARMFVDALQFYRRRGDFLLHAYVVMREHVHLLLTPLGTTDISEVMKLLKRYTSRQIIEWSKDRRPDWLAVFAERGKIDGDRFSVWQRSFRSVPVVGDRSVLDKIAYIHGNPVRKGLVAEPADWRYSSASAYEQPETQDEVDLFEAISGGRNAW